MVAQMKPMASGTLVALTLKDYNSDLLRYAHFRLSHALGEDDVDFRHYVATNSNTYFGVRCGANRT